MFSFPEFCGPTQRQLLAALHAVFIVNSAHPGNQHEVQGMILVISILMLLLCMWFLLGLHGTQEKTKCPCCPFWGFCESTALRG